MEIFILILSILVIISVIMCLLSLNLIHSVFWLTASFISSSLFLINLNLFSIAIIIMIIYVGAIAIMFIFSVMMVDLVNLEESIISLNFLPLVLLISLLLYLYSEFSFLNITEIDYSNFNKKFDFNEIGQFFFNFFNFSIIGSAIILLIPMIGALIFIKWFC